MSGAEPAPALIALLVCPLTRTPLRWDAGQELLVSDAGGVGYPLREGVPVLLVEAGEILTRESVSIRFDRRHPGRT